MAAYQCISAASRASLWGRFGVLLPGCFLKKVGFEILLQRAGIVTTGMKACKYSFLLILKAEEESNPVLSSLL